MAIAVLHNYLLVTQKSVDRHSESFMYSIHTLAYMLDTE